MGIKKIVGGCSPAVVIPKMWLIEQGNPSEVLLQIDQKRILVVPRLAKSPSTRLE